MQADARNTGSVHQLDGQVADVVRSQRAAVLTREDEAVIGPGLAPDTALGVLPLAVRSQLLDGPGVERDHPGAAARLGWPEGSAADGGDQLPADGEHGGVQVEVR